MCDLQLKAKPSQNWRKKAKTGKIKEEKWYVIAQK